METTLETWSLVRFSKESAFQPVRKRRQLMTTAVPSPIEDLVQLVTITWKMNEKLMKET